MNAEVRTVKTDAELALAESLCGRQGRSCRATARSWRCARPRSSGSRRTGLPHRRVEEWKYTDLRALMRDAKPLAGAAGRRRQGARQGRRPPDRRHRCAPHRVRRRRVRAGTVRSRRISKPGLTIRSMAQALAAGDPLVAAHLGKVVPADGDGAVALNTALMSDGAVIHVAARARPSSGRSIWCSPRPATSRPRCSRARWS